MEPPEQNKQGPETPPASPEGTPTSDEIREIVVEMPIRIDLSQEQNPAERLITEKTYRIFSAIQGIMLGLGAYSLSYVEIRHLNMPELASLATRVAIGIIIGGILGKSMNKLVSGLQGSYILDNAKRGDYIKMVRAIIHASLGAGAIASLGVPLVGNFFDFENDLILKKDVAQVEANLETLQTNPFELPKMADIEAGLHRDVVSSLSTTGEITPKAYAKMLLYYDGQHIEFDPFLEPGIEIKKTWPLEDYGQNGFIGLFDSNSWLIQSHRTSWGVGIDAYSPTIQQNFEQYEGTHKTEIGPYKKIVLDSGKIDGVSVMAELAEAIMIGKPPEHKDLFQDVNRLNAWAPFEWNEHWRTLIAERVHAEEDSVINAYSARTQAEYDARFGSVALKDSLSYASTVQALTQLP